jgi:two-component system OmpR family sensor kinase
MEASLTFDLKMAVNLQRTLAIRSSVTMGLALLGIVLWAYVGVRRTLRHQLQDSLETTAQIQDHSLADEGRLIPVRSSPDHAEFVEDINRYVVLRDSAGRIVDVNVDWARELPFDSTAMRVALAGGRSQASLAWNGDQILTLYRRVPPGSPPGAEVMEVGASLAPMEQASREVLYRMAGTALLGSLVVMAGAWWLSRSAMAPVKAIAAQAQAIQGNVDGQRITAHADVLELRGLIEVLNGMLSRVSRTQQWHRRILNDLGHDLRTPITAMRTGMEIALRNERKPEEYRRVITSTMEDVDRLQLITDALSLLGQVESGAITMNGSPVDARTVMENAVTRARRRLDGRTLEWQEPSQPIEVKLDRQLMAKALDQLIDNAIQHTPEGTTIRAGLERKDGRVQMIIEDNGPGVPPEVLPELFDRFYRVHTSRGRHAGAGLGLTTVAAVVELHGGTISAEPVETGGLRVRLELPQDTPPKD